MFLRAVASQSLLGNLKLLGSIAKAQEAQDPQKNPDSLCRHHLHGADIDGLGVVTKPIAKVDPLHVHLAKLLARTGRDEQCQKGVLDISMTPILPLDLAQAGDVAGTKGCCGTSPDDEQHEAWQPHVAECELARHVAGEVAELLPSSCARCNRSFKNEI